MSENLRARFQFWRWLASGLSREPGWKRVINKWTVFHIACGAAAGVAIDEPLSDVGRLAILPVCGALAALSFVWAGTANSIIASPQFRKVALNAGGVEEYAYSFLLAVLVALTTVVLWLVAALGGFALTEQSEGASFIVRTLLFALLCASIREGWGSALAAQWLLISSTIIDSAENNSACRCSSSSKSRAEKAEEDKH